MKRPLPKLPLQDIRQNAAIIAWVTLLICLVAALPFSPKLFPFWDKLLNDFYGLEANSCRFVEIGGRNVFGCVYALVLPAGICAFFIGLRRHKSPQAFKKTFTPLIWALLVLLTVIQLKTQLRQFVFEFVRFSDKPPHEKQALLFKENFNFAQYCRGHILPGGFKRARLVTDIDVKKTPGLFDCVELAYLLYPVDIVTGYSDAEVLVIYKKKDALKSVPPGFKAYPPYDDGSLIAVKETRD